MSGRKKIKLVEYNEVGEHIRNWDSCSELQAHYYEGAKYPLFQRHPKIHFLQNGNYVTQGALGQNWLLQELRLFNDPYKIRNQENRSQAIIIKNVNGETIGWFPNLILAHKLTGQPLGNITSGIASKHSYTQSGLYFYKSDVKL